VGNTHKNFGSSAAWFSRYASGQRIRQTHHNASHPHGDEVTATMTKPVYSGTEELVTGVWVVVAVALVALAVLGVCNSTVRHSKIHDVGALLYHSAVELFLSAVEAGRRRSDLFLAGGFSRYIGRSFPSRHVIPALLSPAFLCSAVPCISPARDHLRHHPGDTVNRLAKYNTRLELNSIQSIPVKDT